MHTADIAPHCTTLCASIVTKLKTTTLLASDEQVFDAVDNFASVSYNYSFYRYIYVYYWHMLCVLNVPGIETFKERVRNSKKKNSIRKYHMR